MNKVYKGSVKDGWPEGQGVFSYNRKISFVGSFTNGMPFKGVLTFKEGKSTWIYSGQFNCNGNIEGYGEREVVNKTRYVGEFKDGRESGKGIFIRQDDKFEGVFKDGFYKSGVYTTLKYGYSIESDSWQGYSTTYGKKTFNDSSIYIGELVHGLAEGIGTKYFYNEDVYKGDFKLGARHGHGKYTFPDGTVYVGNWRKGFIDGEGLIIHPDGIEEKANWDMGNIVKSNGT